MTTLNPYLGFRDNAKDAMTFYHSVFGGELNMSTFAEFQASEDPAEQDKIMHAMLTGEKGLVLMGADTPTTWTTPPATISRCPSAARTRPSSAATGTNCPRAAP